MTDTPTKRVLLDELLPLMRQHGTAEDQLATMQDPAWIEQVSVENLQFLLSQHRELARLKAENEGVWERWRKSKGE